MDQNGPAIPPNDFLLRSASGRTSSDFDPPPEPCGNDPRDGPSVAVYYRDDRISLRPNTLRSAGHAIDQIGACRCVHWHGAAFP